MLAKELNRVDNDEWFVHTANDAGIVTVSNGELQERLLVKGCDALITFDRRMAKKTPALIPVIVVVLGGLQKSDFDLDFLSETAQDAAKLVIERRGEVGYHVVPPRLHQKRYHKRARTGKAVERDDGDWR